MDRLLHSGYSTSLFFGTGLVCLTVGISFQDFSNIDGSILIKALSMLADVLSIFIAHWVSKWYIRVWNISSFEQQSTVREGVHGAHVAPHELEIRWQLLHKSKIAMKQTHSAELSIATQRIYCVVSIHDKRKVSTCQSCFLRVQQRRSLDSKVDSTRKRMSIAVTD